MKAEKEKKEKKEDRILTKGTKKDLGYVNEVLEEASMYEEACRIIEYDQETICPQDAMERQAQVNAFLMTKAFSLTHSGRFASAIEKLYKHREELGKYDRAMVKAYHVDHQKTKNITPEMQHEFSLVYNRAWINWQNAKQQADFSIFAQSLQEVKETELKKIELREERKEIPLDNLIDDYETGMTTEQLDKIFARCSERLVPLLEKIRNSKKTIRTDFLSRPVTDAQQKEMADYLLDVLGFDKMRGSWTTSEHPFTTGIAADDARITTHFYPTMFLSSIYSVIHECGHALFEQLQPAQNHKHHLENKTMGQHESVSRMYENVIGRSRSFIHLIYDRTKEIFPDVLSDVSEEELYEAVNLVQPSLIRTEADEFTYIFHIIIRYEIEKRIVNADYPTQDIPKLWNDMYEKYLGIRPGNDREGCLQDVHWASGFGYFPTYALGNMYNAMYFNKMKEDLNVEECIAKGDFASVNNWMARHVFRKADRQDPEEWIRDITGRDLTPDDFLNYLEEKYTAVYEL